MSSPPENAPSTELPFRLPESADRRAGPVSGTRPLAVWAALAIVYVIWGSTYLGIRIAVETFPPYLSASVRFVAAALVLGALIAVRRGPSELRGRPRQVGAAALVGGLLLTGGTGLVVGAEDAARPLAGSLVAYASYVWLLRHAPISLVSTYAYVNPAVAVLFGALFVHERITVAVLVSGAVTLAGVALVVQSNRS